MLLYIEDNQAIAKNVTTYLEAEWYNVHHTIDGQEWLNLALNGRYECIILDVMLPGIDGHTICREIRSHKSVPIIMTTARWELEDKSEWFDGGVDDYLVKPFELAELVMRVRALIGRTQISDVITLGDVEFALDENRCTRWGEEVKLTLKERQILMELLETPGRTVSRGDIVDAVRWGDALYESDGKLDVYIANLRKKLGKELIETIKWLGYKMRVE